jgi:hypothetical protein
MIYQETNIVVYADKAVAYREAEKDMHRMLEKFGAKVVGSWSTVVGNANEFSVLAAYEDMGQLQKSGMAIMQDKEYQAVWGKLSSCIMSHTRKIMLPMPLSPLK